MSEAREHMQIFGLVLGAMVVTVLTIALLVRVVPEIAHIHTSCLSAHDEYHRGDVTKICDKYRSAR